jgi:hypothetical protein
MDAIDRAYLHAGGVLYADAGFGDDIGHVSSSLCKGT